MCIVHGSIALILIGHESVALILIGYEYALLILIGHLSLALFLTVSYAYVEPSGRLLKKTFCSRCPRRSKSVN